MTHTSELTVTTELTAGAMGSGDLPVLATPAMMALMENAAMLAVRDALEVGQTTVGGQIKASHLCPTKVGQRVTATAEVTAVEEGRLIVRPLQTPLQKPGEEALSLAIPKEAADIAPGTILEIEYDGRVLPAAQDGPAALGQVYSVIFKETD